MTRAECFGSDLRVSVIWVDPILTAIIPVAPDAHFSFIKRARSATILRASSTVMTPATTRAAYSPKLKAMK